MTGRVDLNADMGEGFGLWTMGDDAALLDVVTSANVACGLHAGDWDVMAATMAAAARRGVGIGAHPGFPDLNGFGRRRMEFSPASLRNLVAYQLGAAMAVAVFTLWTGCTTLTFSFPILFEGFETATTQWDGLGMHGVFWLYGVICVLGFAYIFIKLPETKGKSLEQIERELVD